MCSPDNLYIDLIMTLLSILPEFLQLIKRERQKSSPVL